MNKNLFWFLLLCVTIFSVEVSAKAPLVAGTPMELSGKVGHFDFMEIDSGSQRLLAAHKGAGTLALIDLKTGELLPEVMVGQVQGIAIDNLTGTYILGDADEHKIVFVNAKTLKKSGELTVSGPVDAIAFDPKNGMAYADEDDGTHVWVIDVKQQKLAATIMIPGVPEVIAYDQKTDRVYQNIKTKDSVVVINPATNKIEAEWPTLPATAPHGLVVDSKLGRAFVAGHNGKLVGIDLNSGKVFAQAGIASGTDQIAFDATENMIYCASKGFISAVKETDSGLEALGDIPDHAGAHTIAVDSMRHHVWISYADKTHSYLQRFNR
jgi:DNA-binding beta-propeller fold protein YncE